MTERQFAIGIRTIAWIAAATFLIVLGVRDFGPGRRIVREAELDRATPVISTFGPPARVILNRDGVRVLGEPVYADVRLPRWFRRATVELTYENPQGIPIRFGVRTHPTEWRFDLVPITYDRTANGLWGEGRATVWQFENDVVKIQVPFTLERAWQVERNVYQFVLSAPGVSPERPIVIHGFRVIAERDPICLRTWCL